MLTSSSSLLAALGVLASVSGQTSAQAASYGPIRGSCPSIPLLRQAGTVESANQTLSQSESQWISARRTETAPFWRRYLNNGTVGTGYDLGKLAPNESAFPNVGLAVSGGGYRAALYGAGTFSAIDGRNESATTAGVGGLLQAANYMTGLSGGSWFVSSLAIHDFPNMYTLVLGVNSTASPEGWIPERHLVLPDGLFGVSNNRDFLQALSAGVDRKENAGFNVSITDAWGRALSYHFANGTTTDNFYQNDTTTSHGEGLLWSSIRSIPSFSSHSTPFPVIVADSLPPYMAGMNASLGRAYIPINVTEYEFNPYEWGSWDQDLASFIPLEYLGTALQSGQPANNTACVTGFDNFGFVIGTSSSLFNTILNTVNNTVFNGSDSQAIQTILEASLYASFDLGDLRRSVANDVANYPNSFQGVNVDTFPGAQSQQLALVDGGENGENVPLAPLLVKARGVDAIVAFDSSADTSENWPNGTAIITTYNRTKIFESGTTSFPPVPLDPAVWVSLGLNTRPTFFGCNSTAANAPGNLSYPLVVYIPNAPLSGLTKFNTSIVNPVRPYLTNTSTFQLQYSRSDASDYLDAAHQNVLRGYPEGDADSDPNWPVCLQCAVVERTRKGVGLARTSQCQQCFQRYCYVDGVTDTVVTSKSGSGSKSSSSHSALGVHIFAILVVVGAALM